MSHNTSETAPSISDQIRNWNSLNRNTSNTNDWVANIDKVAAALKGLTSFFMLSRDLYENSDHIHIYAGILNGKLTLFYIDAKNDTPNVDINTAMTPLPLHDIGDFFKGDSVVGDKNNTANAVTEKECIRRVYRWGTDWLRDAWISDVVKRPISDDINLNFLFSVLVIDTSDLKQLKDATAHACLLSLKEYIDNTKLAYAPDLTIADLDIENSKVNYMLEDVVYSIPPIKPKFEYSSFGALKQLIPDPKG